MTAESHLSRSTESQPDVDKDPDLPICGRLLVGRGYSDTYDPVCVRVPSHEGRCNGAAGEDMVWDQEVARCRI